MSDDSAVYTVSSLMLELHRCPFCRSGKVSWVLLDLGEVPAAQAHAKPTGRMDRSDMMLCTACLHISRYEPGAADGSLVLLSGEEAGAVWAQFDGAAKQRLLGTSK